MGGRGSGRPRLTDEEKKAKGTFRPSQSAAVYASNDAAKVITGVFLAKVSDPELPLCAVGKKKYFELANLLMNGNKLTQVTRDYCEVVAVIWAQINQRLLDGKSPPMQMMVKYDQMMRELKIAEDAPAIADPTKKNKFSNVGFANTRSTPITLRRSAASGNRK